VPMKLRLSTGQDLKITVRSTDSVLKVKKLLFAQEGIDTFRQRWYFSGRLLHDKLRVEEIKIPKGYVVQVIIAPENLSPVDS
jgi:hypothetical protein